MPQLTSLLSLREREVEAITKLLRGNTPEDKIEWKLLIFDNFCRDVIAPMLKIGDLRKLGITLHMSIKSERHPIKDAPCVYFIEPTEENVMQFVQDCKNDLYHTYLLNFVYPISRPLLERIAKELLMCPQVVPNIKIYDQYLNYVSLEADMFSLQLENSYQLLHAPQSQVSDQDLMRFTQNIVNGLASVIVTMQVIPVIVSTKGGAAQSIADEINKRLTDLMREKQLQPSPTAHRCVLFLTDRDTDIPISLSHTWTYRGLLHDALGMKLNKVELPGEGGSDKPRVMELDKHDSLWKQYAPLEVEKVFANVDDALKDYTKKSEEFKRSGSTETAEEGFEAMGAMMAKFPELKDRKRFLDVHVNLNHALLKKIQDYQLDKFAAIDQTLLFKESVDRPTFNSLLKDDKCRREDRIRLLCLYYMTREAGDEKAEKEIRDTERLLADLNVNMSALQFLRSQRTLKSARVLGGGGQERDRTQFSEFMTTFTKSMKDRIETGIAEVTTRGKIKLLTLTQMIQTILQEPGEGRAAQKRSMILENLHCIDPKTNSAVHLNKFGFNEAIVFVVGGGNYPEYQNLKDWEQQQPNKAVLYGSTDIINGDQFLNQLQWLQSVQH